MDVCVYLKARSWPPSLFFLHAARFFTVMICFTVFYADDTQLFKPLKLSVCVCVCACDRGGWASLFEPTTFSRSDIFFSCWCICWFFISTTSFKLFRSCSMCWYGARASCYRHVHKHEEVEKRGGVIVEIFGYLKYFRRLIVIICSSR